MLFISDVSLYVGGKLLLNDASLSITAGARIGVIGRNGCGKSHLMQLLEGSISPDSGKRTVNKDTSVLLVKQELPDENETPLEFIRSNDPDIIEAEAQLASATSQTIEEASNRVSTLDEERYEHLAPIVLMGLGLTEQQINQPMCNLSDGMRMRIGLATALIRKPDVLLMDEPSNYLDLESTQWLINYLNNYPSSKAVVVVSHDLALLKQVTKATVHMRSGTLTLFSGDYEQYRKQLAAREKNDIDKNKALEKQIERHETIYHRFKDLPESRAAQAVAQLKKADLKREQLVDIVQEEPVIELKFIDPTRLEDPIIEIKNITIGYQDKAVLSKVSLNVQANSKIGILGQNGQGKSTLLRAIVGTLPVQKGEIIKYQGLRIAYFSQDLTEELTKDLSVYDEFQKKTNIQNEQATRSTLAKYGFQRDKINTLTQNLSGGEKSRLLFCIICSQQPQVIILDEPTNHLDVETREVLETAINTFKGCIIMVSHDAELHLNTMNQFWLVKNAKVHVYEKGLVHYQSELQGIINTNLAPYKNTKSNSNNKLSSASSSSSKQKSSGNDAKVSNVSIFKKNADTPSDNNNNNNNNNSSVRKK